jgi:glycerophosphoryl diester phosphodiesterase
MRAHAPAQAPRTPVEATAVVAHRGSWGPHPANTLAAFEEAVRVGVDMIEFDIRRTEDGRLVVHHDADLDDLPLATLRHRDLLAMRTSPPPLLDEVLELARGRVAVNPELKEPGCTREVIRRLAAFGSAEVLLTSFLDSVIAEAKALAPELRAGLLVGRGLRQQRPGGFVSDLFPLRRLQNSHADVLVLHHRLADAGVLRRASAAGMSCLVWTVNGPGRLDRFLSDPRVAGVITDDAALALRRRQALGHEAQLTPRTASAGRC